MVTTRVHLGADLYASPLWSPGLDGKLSNVALDDYALTPSLKRALERWASRYDELFEQYGGRFPASQADCTALDEAGKGLWEELVSELGGHMEIHYDSPITGQSTLVHRPSL